MSGSQDHFMEGTPLDQFEPRYTVYDNQYTGSQRTSDPSTPYEGFGFWYRPESQETVYNADAAFTQQTRSASQSTMDMPLTLKHKRTRSGCFTCRQRRVKCDETKPVCDRCRKGNRQCEFPSKSSGSKKGKQTSPTSPTIERTRLGHDEIPASIKEESEEDLSDGEEDEPSPKQKFIAQSPAQQLVTSQFPTSTAAPIITTPSSQASGLTTNISSLWKDLKPDMQMYLQFQRDQLTHYHYAFKVDAEDFVHDELITLALQFEPLLYAVLAFAAYHHTVRLPDEQAEFSCFWKYYCQSIIRLRQHLESDKNRDDVVLLTVLQLATFEEYMGDWNSLVSHHKAAFGILTSRYTPQTIMRTERGRKIFDWYIRLDVIAGLMSVHDAVLDRSWLAYAYGWHEERSKHTGPDQLQHKLDFFTKSIELIGHDIAHLFAEASETLTSNDVVRMQDFSVEGLLLGVRNQDQKLDDVRQQIQELHDPSLARAEQKASPYAADTIFKPDVPLFRGALWPLNFVWVDWYAVLILLKNSMLATLQKAQMVAPEDSQQSPQIELLQQQAMTILPELERYSKTQCEIYNAIAMSTSAPAGVTLVCYASFALSTVFLPKAPPAENSRYTMWARQQLANFERQGFIWPPHFRKEMANLWSIPEIENWWLPNEEGKTRIIDEIRSVVVERSLIAQRKEKPGQDQGRDLREIRGLFEMMDLGRRGSMDMLSSSYLSSPTGTLNAAGVAGTPTSSAGSLGGFISPRGSISDPQAGNQPVSSRRQSQSSVGLNVTESPVAQSRPATLSNRMSGIWEDKPK